MKNLDASETNCFKVENMIEFSKPDGKASSKSRLFRGLFFIASISTVAFFSLEGIAEICVPPNVTRTAPMEGTAAAWQQQPRLDEGTVFAFVDASLGMAGFAQAGQSADGARPVFGETVSALPALVVGIGNEAAFHRFGPEITPISAEDFSAADDRRFFRCSGEQKQCGQRAFGFARVFDLAAKASPASLFVIVTDLFMERSEFVGNKGIQLRANTNKILESGRVIGINGFQSTFKGSVRNLPSGRNYLHATTRPLFVVMIGPLDKVENLKERLEGALVDVPAAQSRFSVFGRQGVISHPYGTPEGPKPKGITVNGIVREELNEVLRDFDQVLIEPGHGALSLGFDFRPLLASQYGIPLGDFAASETLWHFKEKGGDCGDNWVKFSKFRGFSHISWKGPAALVRLFSETPKLPRNKLFVWRVQISSKGLDLEGPRLSWFDEWSFDADMEAEIVGAGVSFFPTLNLSLFGGALKTAVAEHFSEQQLVDYFLAFKLKK